MRHKRLLPHLKTGFTMLLTGILLFSQISGYASASTCSAGISNLDCSAITGGWVDWVPNACAEVINGNTPLSGTDNYAKIFNFFVQNGYTPPQAAGIVGNIRVESHGDPLIYEGDGKDYTFPPSTTAILGWGIVQWTPPGKITDYATATNKKPGDLNTQLTFLLAQLNGTVSTNSEVLAGQQLKKATTAYNAAVAFLQYYERAADSSPTGPNAQLRGGYAVQALTAYGAGSQTSGSTPSPGSASSSTSCGSGTTITGTNVTGNTVFYSQHDPRWAYEHFTCGGDCGTFSAEGCYLASLAMIASTLTGKYYYPDAVANGGARLSYSGNMGAGGLASDPYHLKVISIDGDANSSGYGPWVSATNGYLQQVITALQSGELVLAHGDNPNGGPWVAANHWVVIRGYDATKKALLINDPWDFTRAPTPTQGPSNIDPNSQRGDGYGHVGPYTYDAWPLSAFYGTTNALYAFSK